MKLLLSPAFIAILFLVILGAFGLKGLAQANFYTSHDGETHTARIAQYYGAIKDKQIPPRFAPSLYSYLGSPIFVYIYPLPYQMGSALHAIGFSYINSFKVLTALSFIFSAIFSYLWLKEVLKSHKAAFLGALFYVWVPYKFLLIYVRASLSELLAYTFVPLALYTLTRLTKEKSFKWTAFCALSLSGVLLSQNLVALITFPVIAAYVLIYAFVSKSPKYFALALISFIWSFAISAFTYLPSFLEREYVHFDRVITQRYIDHFVTFKQLLYSPWGYGFDLPGTVNDQLSFQIGLAHILILIIAAALVFYPLLKRNNLVALNGKRAYILNSFFIAIFGLSIFLMVQIKPAVYLWENIKQLKIIDLPWRFLGLVSLSLAFISAYAIKSIKPGIIFLLLIVFVLVANRNHLRINQVRTLDDNFFQNYTQTATQYGEFTPKWRQSTKVPLYFDSQTRVEVTDGNAEITNVKSNSKITTFDVEAMSQISKVRINKLYFPKTEVKVDGQKITPTITDSKNLDLTTQQDTSGLIQVDIPNGNHSVSVQFKETNLRLFADLLSAVSALLAAIFILKNVKV